jgi:uncharacterized membrane protein YhaH (DUF805 family)
MVLVLLISLVTLTAWSSDLGPGAGAAERIRASLFLALACWIHWAVCVKRLHDRDRSGWWYLVYVALPLVLYVGVLGLLVQFAAKPGLYLFAAELAAIAAFVAGMIELGARVGSAGANAYGPAPG